MKQSMQIFVVVIMVVFLLFTACEQIDDTLDEKNLYDKATATIKDDLKAMKLSNEVAQEFTADVYNASKSNDSKTLRTIGLKLQDEIENKDETALDKQLLFYVSHFYAADELKKEVSNDKALEMTFLSIKNVDDDDIRLSLMDIGIVTSLAVSELDEIRDKAVSLVKGKEKTQEDLITYTNELEDMISSLNRVDAAAVSQVFSLAQEEAIKGSKKYPLD